MNSEGQAYAPPILVTLPLVTVRMHWSVAVAGKVPRRCGRQAGVSQEGRWSACAAHGLARRRGRRSLRRRQPARRATSRRSNRRPSRGRRGSREARAARPGPSLAEAADGQGLGLSSALWAGRRTSEHRCLSDRVRMLCWHPGPCGARTYDVKRKQHARMDTAQRL